MLVIGPRGQSAAALAAKQFGSPFPVLADPTRGTYRLYGFTKSLWVIQKSGSVLVDRDGVVQYVHRSTNPQHSFVEAEVMRVVGQFRAGGR